MANLILITGIYRSGSTWSLNVLRAWLLKLLKNQVTFCVAVGEESVTRECSVILRKLHDSENPRWITMLGNGEARSITTLREPQACIQSLMSTFDLNFERAFSMMQVTLEHAGWLAGLKTNFFVPYGGIKNILSRVVLIRQICRFAFGKCTLFEALGIENRTSIKQTCKRIAEAEANPGRIKVDGQFQYDMETLYHLKHVSNLRKTIELSGAQKSKILDFLEPKYHNLLKFCAETSSRPFR